MTLSLGVTAVRETPPGLAAAAWRQFGSVGKRVRDLSGVVVTYWHYASALPVGIII